MSQKAEFTDFLSRAISQIPQDVKIHFEFIDDAELPEEAHLRAAGTLLYLLAPGDLVPDTFGVLGHVDDALVFRMSMAATLKDAPDDRVTAYRERYPEVFGTLEADLAVASEFLGELYPWIETRLEEKALGKIEFKGKRAQMTLDDTEDEGWLYGEVSEALLDFDVDDDELARELRRIDKIIPIMQQKMAASRR